MGHRSIRFPEGLEAQVVAVAAAEGRSFSKVVVRALEQALGGGETGVLREKPADPAPVGSEEPARSAAPARARRALEREPSGSGPVEQGASVEAGTAPSRAPRARPASVEEVVAAPIPKIARRHWAS